MFLTAREPFVMTFSRFHENRIGDYERLNLDERLYSLAMARTKHNLHTPVERGEVAQLLGRMKNGVWVAAPRTSLLAACQRNIRNELFEPDSDVNRCLILSSRAFYINLKGRNAPCKKCGGRSTSQRKAYASNDVGLQVTHEENLRVIRERADHRRLFDENFDRSDDIYDIAGQGHNPRTLEDNWHLAEPPFDPEYDTAIPDRIEV